jgi:hypothetical protein
MEALTSEALRQAAIDKARAANSRPEGAMLIRRFNYNDVHTCFTKPWPSLIKLSEVWPEMPPARLAELEAVVENEALQQQRQDMILAAWKLPPLDAVALMIHCNKWLYVACDRKHLTIDITDIFPALSVQACEDLARAGRAMYRDARILAAAIFCHAREGQSNAEDERCFREKNPGFSEDSYQFAIHLAMFERR